MEINILDGPEKNFKAIIQKLRTAGLADVYEKKGWLMVRQSEAVQVKVKHNGVKYEVQPLFPQIGNFIQIISTLALWVLLGYIGVPLSVVFAILLGQAISYGYHFRKIKALSKRVDEII